MAMNLKNITIFFQILIFTTLVGILPRPTSAHEHTEIDFSVEFLIHEAELDQESIRNILKTEIQKFFLNNGIKIDRTLRSTIIARSPEEGWNSIYVLNKRTGKEEYIGVLIESSEGHEVTQQDKVKYFRLASSNLTVLLKNVLRAEEIGDIFLPLEARQGFMLKQFTHNLASKLNEVLTVFFEDLELYEKLAYFEESWSNSYLVDTPLFFNDLPGKYYNQANIQSLTNIDFFKVIDDNYLFSRVSTALLKMPKGFRLFFSKNPLKSINFAINFCANHEKARNTTRHLSGAYNRDTSELYLCMHETDYSSVTSENLFANGYSVTPGQTLIHEMGHHLFHKMTSEKRKEFSQIGWDEKLFGGYKAKKGYKYVSHYAKVSPSEDFSESFAQHILRPRGLKITNPDSFAFIENLNKCLSENENQTKCGLE